MIHYILQVVVFQVIFLLVYDLFLKRETFFIANRCYLLFTVLLSFLIPFIELDVFVQMVPKEFVIALPEIIIGELDPRASIATDRTITSGSLDVHEPISIWPLVFWAGLAISLFLFMIKLGHLLWLQHNNPRRWKGNLLIVSLTDSNAAFSFFNRIFLGDTIKTEQSKIIIQHEAVHAKQWHTLDLLFIEALRIVMWFNPLLYIYQQRIKTVHEFIADAQAIKQHGKKHYYQDLLNQIFETKSFSFTNSFYKKSLIKKRIVMLQKSKSQKLNLLKYVFVIPIVFAMLFYSSCEKQMNSNDKNTVDLEHFSYKTQKDEIISSEAKKIQDSYQAFLWANPDYVSWAEMNHETGEISYSVHHKSEEVPGVYTEAEVGNKDGSSYKMYMNFNYFGLDVTDRALADNTKAQKIESNQEIITVNDNGKMEVPFSIIENAPIFSTCKKFESNDQRKKCTSNEIAKFISKNFNTDLGTQYDLAGRHRISAWFKIDTQGNILDIGARTPHPVLEDEVKRVINLLPKFEPGTHRGKEVTVSYALPIVFQIADNKED